MEEQIKIGNKVVEFLGKADLKELGSKSERKSKWSNAIKEFINSKKPAMKIIGGNPISVKKYKKMYPQLHIFMRGKNLFIVNKDIVNLDEVWESEINA